VAGAADRVVRLRRSDCPIAQVIEICPYDPAWPSLFAALGVRLRGVLGSVALRIDHIGSTSVPGLAAKPIVDVQVSVAAFDPVDAYRVPLEGLGLVFRSENPQRTKRYFREAPGTRRTHIHVRRAGSWGEQFALLFRDYLRAHPEDRDRYAELKRCLARELQDDRHVYTEAKARFMWEVMSLADRWSQDVGWAAGPSDA
jgi:GrpB-like predicted nucleotidyltransferase (UPF0157 family)